MVGRWKLGTASTDVRNGSRKKPPRRRRDCAIWFSVSPARVPRLMLALRRQKAANAPFAQMMAVAADLRPVSVFALLPSKSC